MNLTWIKSDLHFATETRVLELAKEDDNGTFNPIHQYSPALRGIPRTNMKDNSRIESNAPEIRPHLPAVARQYKDNSVFSPYLVCTRIPAKGTCHSPIASPSRIIGTPKWQKSQERPLNPLDSILIVARSRPKMHHFTYHERYPGNVVANI